MSKKIAGGAQGIVLDVKLGNGAFMADLKSARELAETMVAIGEDVGRNVIAVLSDMNQPLGSAIGNALEVAEAIETLQGGGPDDFREHVLVVAALMLKLAGRGEKWTNPDEVRALLEEKLRNGDALRRFRDLIGGQGGDVSYVDDPGKLPQARIVQTVTAEKSGCVQQVSALDAAKAAFELGAGREKKEDPIDLAVGVKIHVKVGERVEAGAPLVTIYANDSDKVPAALNFLRSAIVVGEQPVEPLPLFYDVIYGA
jgi:pyrimidine-nucleoside phosphorylase